MAIDGTSLRLPSDAALLKFFGGLGRKKTAVTASASLLYDLENDIVVDARIAPLSTGERSLAEENLKVLKALDSFNSGHRKLLVFDRGYPSPQFINSVSDKQIAYVMRVKNGFFRKPDIDGVKNIWLPLGYRDKVSGAEAEAGTGELFRQACGDGEAGFFCDDDGGEYDG